MSKPSLNQLARRERQIMEIVYRLGQATAADVLAELPDPPSYSAVRAHLRILEDKGHLRHNRDGVRYVFSPIVGRDRARRSRPRLYRPSSAARRNRPLRHCWISRTKNSPMMTSVDCRR